MNGANVEKAYRMSVKRERDRERKWRKSKRYGEIRNTFHFFDFEAAEAAEVSPSWLSDKKAGKERIIAHCDGEFSPSHYARCIRKARERVRRFAPYLLDVFHLVVVNGSNREESIGTLAARRHLDRDAAKLIYYRHRERLLALFGER